MEELFVCKICHISLDSEKILLPHMEHQAEKTLPIISCGKRFNKNTMLVTHSRIHTKEKPYKCSFCDKTFRQKPALNVHLKYHTGKILHECLVCGKKQTIECESDFNKVYRCEHCNKECPTWHQLKTHFRGHETSTKRQIAIELEEFRCQFCAKLLGDKGTLARHIAESHKKETRYECYNCDQKFYHKYMLVRHIKEKHTGVPPTCDICGLEFSTYATLRRHIADKHEVDFKDLYCYECKKSFVGGISYRKHMRKHTDDGAKYVCSVCGKILSSMSSMRDHMTRRHSEQTPYECDQCEKAFTTPLSLKTHKLTHIGPSFKCDLCHKQFIQPASLRIHMKRVHVKLRPHPCDICAKYFATRTELKKHHVRCKGPKPEKDPKSDYKSISRYEEQADEIDMEPTKIQCGMCAAVFPNKKKFVEHSMKLIGQQYTCCKCRAKFRTCMQLYQHYDTHKPIESTDIVIEDDDGDVTLNYTDQEEIMVQPTITEANELFYILDDSSCVNEVVIEEDEPTAGAQPRPRKETVEIVNLEHGYVVSNIGDYMEEEVEDDEGNILITRKLADAINPSTSKTVISSPRTRNPQPKKRHEVPDFSATNYMYIDANNDIEVPHYKCLRCEQLFINKFGFFRHIEKGKCYINNCDVCTDTFTKNTDFYDHYITEHTDRAICNFCFRTFMYEKNVKEHMLRHLDQFRHRCEDCNKGFYTVREYRNHYKNRHMGIRHKCEVCGRSFADEYYFKRHIATHAKAANTKIVYKLAN
ncbi:hypothetical protein JTB14_006877 [Gonioctena quinquepunctata]|nr:hypothetical protein JTB14_006877 [Gonioctena quinquepunctata]